MRCGRRSVSTRRSHETSCRRRNNCGEMVTRKTPSCCFMRFSKSLRTTLAPSLASGTRSSTSGMRAAEAQFTRALGKDPQNAPILFRKGELLERKGRWGAAVQYYNRAIALRWNYPEPWLVKGEILLNHDRPTEALECFEKVASFEPQRIEAWAGAARADAALG